MVEGAPYKTFTTIIIIIKQRAARKRWAAAPSTQSSAIESSVVHVVDYHPRRPFTVVRG